MFESRFDPLLSRRAFFGRMRRSLLITLGIVVFSLAGGSAGYHWLGDLPWVDSVLNASMILTGMGPVDPMRTTAAKLFATFYSLYSGVAFLTMIGVVTAPIFHRFLHRFHVEEEDDAKSDSADDDQKPG